MMKSVLVGLDGSSRSERSLPWVRQMLPGAKVTLARFLEFIDPRMVGARFVADLQDAARMKLDALAGTFTPKASTLVKQGNAAFGLLSAARDSGADLIALTTHGGSSLARRFFGRTTEKLLHTADVPLLVVPAWDESPPPDRLRTIAVLLDGSEASEKILPLVRSVALEHRAHVHLIHGLTTLDLAEKAFAEMEGHARRSPVIEMLEKNLEEARRETEAKFESLAAALKKDGVRASFACVSGNVPEILVTTAENASADLVIMAGHGYGAVKRAILGSVASRFIREASMPVLVARYDALQRLPAPVQAAGRRT